MRDILNLLDSVVIAEGVGLANRKPGDLFKNPEGDVIAFQNLDFYPESGNYKDLTDANEAIEQVTQSLGIAPEQIMWTNQPPKSIQLGGAGYAGFGIATFKDAKTDGIYYLGRYFDEIRTVPDNDAAGACGKSHACSWASAYDLHALVC